MLLREAGITYVTPCLADPGKIRLTASLSDDITEVMPYLNAVVDDAIYNHEGKFITLYKEFRMITLYPQELTMIKAYNTTDAMQVIDWLQDLINDTYSRREEIEPDYEMKRRPHPLQLYEWLPRLNCGKCGMQNCLAFAAHVFSGQQDLKKCEPLFTEEYREYREVLLEMAAALGYEVEVQK